MNSRIVFAQEALFSVMMTLVSISFNFFAFFSTNVSLSCAHFDSFFNQRIIGDL